MDIRLNGKRTPVAGGITIGEVIRTKDLDPSTVVVEHNLTIIPAKDWGRVNLKENDNLEILGFVGGG
jgi:thiamine biosynthesis protein ThiS